MFICKESNRNRSWSRVGRGRTCGLTIRSDIVLNRRCGIILIHIIIIIIIIRILIIIIIVIIITTIFHWLTLYIIRSIGYIGRTIGDRRSK